MYEENKFEEIQHSLSNKDIKHGIFNKTDDYRNKYY